MWNFFILIHFILINASLLMAQTKVIAHRGFSSAAPENTLAAFQMAIDIEADYFELDIHKTKDNKIVCIHDKTTDKTTSNNSSGTISKLTLDELESFKVGYSEKFGEKFNNERIPTLKEALVLAKGKIKVCIEIKVKDVEKEVVQIVNDLEMKEQVIIFSFYYNVLQKIRELDVEIPILYLQGNADKNTVSEALVISAQAIGVGRGTKITEEFVKYIHENDLEIWQWTVNEESDMQILIDFNVDGIITDFPDLARTLLKRQ